MMPHIGDTVWVDGLSPKRPQDNHFSPHALTGVGREGRPDGGIISVEQFIGDKLENTPDKRPIKSLLLGTGRRVRVGVLPEQRPAADHRLALSAFNTVFSGGVPTGGVDPSELLPSARASSTSSRRTSAS